MDGKKISKYAAPEQTDFGLFLYRTNAAGLFAKDLYIHSTANGQVEFTIECYNKDKKPAPPVYQCISGSKKLYDNVYYKYEFTLKHLPEAVEINRLVESIVDKTTQENLPFGNTN